MKKQRSSMCLGRVMGIFLFLLKKIVGGFNGVYINIVFKITQFFDLHKSNFFLWVTVFVSWGCCNKWLQSWSLKTTEVYSFIVLEAKSTKPRYPQGLAPSRGSGENPFHVPLWASGDPSTLWHSLVCGHISPVFGGVLCTWLSFLCLSGCPLTHSYRVTFTDPRD